MSPLGQLRAQGLRFTADGSRLLVSPRRALSKATKATIRINKAAILHELDAEAAARQGAIIAAEDAANLEEWHAPLVLGRLHLCGNCVHYTFGQDPAAPGTCSKHGDGLLAFAMPFECQEFVISRVRTARKFLPSCKATTSRNKTSTDLTSEVTEADQWQTNQIAPRTPV
jgi:hypothetical protein